MNKPGFERHLESLSWRTTTLVEKYSKDQVRFAINKLHTLTPSGDQLSRLCGAPEDGVVEDLTSNLVTTAGLTRITNVLIAGGQQAMTGLSTRLGVGNSTTVATIGDTDLGAAAGSTNRQFYIMDATYPVVSAGVMTFKSTYASADANFSWQEWGIDIGTPTVSNGTTVNACFVNHKISNMGTKSSGAAWALTATLTLS